MEKLSAFVAYRHTGESMSKLEDMLGRVCYSLGVIGVDSYCTLFDEANFKSKKMNPAQIMKHAFEVIDAKDLLFVVQSSNDRSEGMLMEVGYCIAKQKPIIVATQDGIQDTYLPGMADIAFRFGSFDHLERKIQSLDLSELQIAN